MLVKVSIWLIFLYRRVASDKLRACCRYEPSCSEYAILALRKYSFFKGWKMTVKRLFSCRYPYGGIDYP
ncbi:membrane protein insertion efficiency factor YidD [Vreelandella titanicae]|uniref:membrane protein insertion efficiency factor YidD n=1 Tax=Vreelandella titanicae TaxID=664683 RepID=UPI00158072F2|nr:membrane protein insertion efficiency factor YidD [Halomonas titanicae]